MRRITGIALALLFLAPGARAGDIGKDLERGLGRMVADELESTYGVVDDPVLTGWVNRLGQKLASVSGRTDVKYQFKVLDSDDVNAVAAPGGFIYVNRGTLQFVKTEDELASVLGHEVGHVAGKHAMKQLGAQLLGTLALVGFRAAHSDLLSNVGGIAGGLAMLKFSRDEESDADRRGLRNAVNSGYDGGAMLSFFRRLQTTEKDKPTRFDVYFLTHPATEERMARISKEPGTSLSMANAASLGEGLASRSLFREAAATYRRALELSPGNTDLKLRLAEVTRLEPKLEAAKPVTPAQRDEQLKQLAEFRTEMSAVQRQVTDDQRQLENAQKGSSQDLDLAARSLSDASQLINQRESIQYREFIRMARAFDRAVRINANVRAARDITDDTLEELGHLTDRMEAAVKQGDGSAALEIDSLLMVGPSMLTDLGGGLKQVRGRAGDARSSARTLRLAADSLLSSFRSPFGFSGGQFDILDVQVSSAHDSLEETVDATHRALGTVAHARMLMLVSRINFVTRCTRPDDPATASIIAHYLGVQPSDVRQMRTRLEFGDSALALADQELDKPRDSKKRKASKFANRADESVQKGLKWENSTVLFNLMANDLERETTGA